VAERIDRLAAGQLVLTGGDRALRVSAELADAFEAGDQLLVSGDTLLHVPASEARIAADAVATAADAFSQLAQCSDDDITLFFHSFASALTSSSVVDEVLAANGADVADAQQRGRSTTRLELTSKMINDMVAGLQMWGAIDMRRDETVDVITHDGWGIEVRRAPVGVVGFVFEGRPNVFADAAGVLRTGNTAVLRIGSDALRTAQALMEHAVGPALATAGLPASSIVLVASRAHAAGWALFSDRRLALAVARGSGPAVDQLGSIARAAGTPASLHGTGGAWMIIPSDAETSRVEPIVAASLDRKVCNTLNVCCVLRSIADEMVPAVIRAAATAATSRGATAIVRGDAEAIGHIESLDLEGLVRCEPLPDEGLSHEYEWENNPEFAVVLVDSVEEAISLCNEHSPHFVVSVLTDDAEIIEQVYSLADAPFVGNGFTRWVDGQYALGQPELGLSNWQGGRLLGRGGVLSGSSVHTLRLLARFADPTIHR